MKKQQVQVIRSQTLEGISHVSLQAFPRQPHLACIRVACLERVHEPCHLSACTTRISETEAATREFVSAMMRIFETDATARHGVNT